ncbi:MAG: MotA/TolQ/ExbB proton channel family protein [Candidatus Eisenbacteria bacterium]|nr:MotA/TolQ/ExbB proton channel family protein [Candidatus Eisenbacteria bacterium]
MEHLVTRTYEYILQGGWVMIPLSIASIILWTFMLERLSVLRALRRNDITIDQAIDAVRNQGTPTGGEGLRARLVRDFLEHRSGVAKIDVSVLKESAMRQQPSIGRFLSMITVLVSIAPLMGLLGTVLGMIETFQVIALFGTGNAGAMANGISIALITTETGLLIAVPGLMLSGMLLVQAARLRTQLEEDVTILSRIIRRRRCADHDVRRFGNVCTAREPERRPELTAVPALAGAYSEGGEGA